MGIGRVGDSKPGQGNHGNGIPTVKRSPAQTYDDPPTALNSSLREVCLDEMRELFVRSRAKSSDIFG